MEPSLIASMAYSTWKRRPSGEKVFTPRSYSLRVRYIVVAAIVWRCVAGSLYLLLSWVGQVIGRWLGSLHFDANLCGAKCKVSVPGVYQKYFLSTQYLLS